ncbi:hypothetical protein CYMTET_18841 [Cymbomonas tetramitiformis]|uniref:5'-3' DNA helicase ZGRF1-like N-terminal domain-containing protein n=1 Tax=Cymbomonas tetramitiformis TaxID=36881 RepID=A0AAE0G7X3_9CHLO|nr:hypothetical protein CYMTET_18841 [Cymbomonas tetramitiformis]
MYTRHKTQKRKSWVDGFLQISDTTGTLFTEEEDSEQRSELEQQQLPSRTRFSEEDVIDFGNYLLQFLEDFPAKSSDRIPEQNSLTQPRQPCFKRDSPAGPNSVKKLSSIQPRARSDEEILQDLQGYSVPEDEPLPEKDDDGCPESFAPDLPRRATSEETNSSTPPILKASNNDSNQSFKKSALMQPEPRKYRPGVLNLSPKVMASRPIPKRGTVPPCPTSQQPKVDFNYQCTDAPARKVAVPDTFNSLENYKAIFLKALFEEMTLKLMDIASKFRTVMKTQPAHDRLPGSLRSQKVEHYQSCELKITKARAAAAFRGDSSARQEQEKDGQRVILGLKGHRPPPASCSKGDLWIISSTPVFVAPNPSAVGDKTRHPW